VNPTKVLLRPEGSERREKPHFPFHCPHPYRKLNEGNEGAKIKGEHIPISKEPGGGGRPPWKGGEGESIFPNMAQPGGEKNRICSRDNDDGKNCKWGRGLLKLLKRRGGQ